VKADATEVPAVKENLSDDSSASSDTENAIPDSANHTHESSTHIIEGDTLNSRGDIVEDVSSKLESTDANINTGSLVVSPPKQTETDYHVDETTSLLESKSAIIIKDVESLSTFDGMSESPSDSTERHMRFLDEIDRPWPSTFERSISLLAGPTMDTTFIEQVTKSPKVTINLPMRAKMNVYNTPDMNKFRPGIAKMQSLDFSSDRLGKRAMEAKLYRMNTLVALDGNKGKHETDVAGRDKKMKKDTGKDEEKASFGQCVFNMSNILMGVGMLGLPYVFKSAGWVGGFVVTLIFSSAAWRTSILLGRELNGDPRPCHMFPDDPFKSPTIPGSKPNARMRKAIHSFPDIAREAFGNTGSVLLSVVLYFELFSCLCIFLVTLGDHLHSLYPNTSEAKHMVHVAILLTVPTALLRTPKLLSYLSAVGTVATILVVSCVVYEAIYNGDISASVAAKSSIEPILPPYHKMWDSSGLPVALGLIAYTFSGHAIVPSIYDSMRNKQHFEKMIGTTFAVVLISCLGVAVGGYYMFGSTVDDQITLSLQKNGGSGDMLLTLLTWMMVLTAFSKFTLSAFPLALGMEEIVAPYLHSDNAMEVVSSIIKVVLIVLSLLVAIYCPSFSFICSLVGLICTMTVSVIFPAAAHLKLFGSRLAWWDIGIDCIFIIFGTVMAVTGTVTTVFQEMEKDAN